MKLILLVEGTTDELEDLFGSVKDSISDKRKRFVDTVDLEENPEKIRLRSAVKSFLQSDDEILLSRFSGKEDIVRELGDDCPQMLICLSYNKNSQYYTDNMEQTAREIVDMIKREEKEVNIAKQIIK